MQLYISANLRGNKKTRRHDQGAEFMRLLNGEPYKDATAPTVFLGCYNLADYRAIKNHKGKAIVWWGGTDITKMLKARVRFPEGIKHYAQTPTNQNELKMLGINAGILPLVYADPEYYKLTPIGKSIYFYAGWAREKFYGIDTIAKVAREFPDVNFIITRYRHRHPPFPNAKIYKAVDKGNLRTLYARCFCSLRPTRHDGFSQSVAELALMGRRTAWLYQYPCSKRCITPDDYIEFVASELKRKQPSQTARKFIIDTIATITEEKFG